MFDLKLCRYEFFEGVPLNELCISDIATVESIIFKYVSTFCELDTLPTWLLKECIGELAHVITSIIHVSVWSCSYFFKVAHIKLLLIKTRPWQLQDENYKPISKLKFVSKI